MESLEDDSFCLPINPLFLINCFWNYDEEINVLFIGMLCLRTLEVHTFDVVNASILTKFSTLLQYKSVYTRESNIEHRLTRKVSNMLMQCNPHDDLWFYFRFTARRKTPLSYIK